MRTPLTWLIYIQLGLYAYFLYGFGPIVGFLRDEQGTSHALASLHSTAMAIGAMIGGGLFPRYAARVGRHRVMWTALGQIAIGVLGLVVFPASYAMTLALCGLIAFGGMWVVAATVTSLSQLHPVAGSSAISEANAMAVAAGFVAPLMIGWSVDSGLGWRPGMAVLVGLIVVVALVAWRMRLDGGTVAATGTAVRAVPATPLARAYWYTWLMMVLTGAVEIGLSLWAAVVLREHMGLSPAAASAAVSAILAGMLAGRIGGARLALRYPAIPLYLGALAVSLAGFAVFWFAGGAGPAIVGLFVVGVGNAMHYPLAVAVSLDVAGDQADRAAGIGSYGMGLSFGVGPFLLGLLADRFGGHSALLLVPVLLVLAATLAWRLRALTRPPQVDKRISQLVEQSA